MWSTARNPGHMRCSAATTLGITPRVARRTAGTTQRRYPCGVVAVRQGNDDGELIAESDGSWATEAQDGFSARCRADLLDAVVDRLK